MSTAPDEIRFHRTVPILRIFDEAKAREYYLGFLGFSVVFEHRFAPEAPVYMEIAREGVVLHLSEHHGDASPGSTVLVRMTGVLLLHKELDDKNYKYNRPGVEQQPWGLEMTANDPFGNRIRFLESRGSQNV